LQRGRAVALLARLGLERNVVPLTVPQHRQTNAKNFGEEAL